MFQNAVGKEETLHPRTCGDCEKFLTPLPRNVCIIPSDVGNQRTIDLREAKRSRPSNSATKNKTQKIVCRNISLESISSHFCDQMLLI
jgi:hypothetical protein